MQILDEDEQPLPAGERGEICLRARSNPHYPIGYWNRPEDTEEVFGGEWFHTKDAAMKDEDGYVWYAGRADDVIISAGYRIGPFEVESACVEHPAVKEAAAVASPDERRGNIVKAFIVLTGAFEASDELADEIKRHVRERHSAYAYPREIEFVDDLPKTLTGKIRRVELRERERSASRQALRAEPACRPQDLASPSGNGGIRVAPLGPARCDRRLRDRHAAGCPRGSPRRRRPPRPAPSRLRRRCAARVVASLRALRRAVAPDDHPLQQALGPVELQREEAEPEEDRHDARPRHARDRDMTIPARTTRTPSTTIAARCTMLRCLWRAFRSWSLIRSSGRRRARGGVASSVAISRA